MVVIVDYGIGNIGSIMNMIRKAGGESIFTSDPAMILQADKLIIPGVGSFDNGMNELNGRGLTEVLNKKVLEAKTPVLGVCLGMQLMSHSSEEGVLPGLGWINARTVKFAFPPDAGLRIPHMGWNDVHIHKEEPLFCNMPEDPSFYFVHSYHLLCENKEDVSCTTHYGYEFTSAIQHDNIMATQFHPEKSHTFGLQVVRNFLGI
jgi:glutamine amidotransferase